VLSKPSADSFAVGRRQKDFFLGADYTSDFVCDFMCNLLHIADAICCICDLVSDKNHVRSFARAANRTPNHMCDTNSHLRHQIASTTPNCICDLACDFVSMRFCVCGSFAVAQLDLEITHQIAQQIATQYRTANCNTISHATCKR
jgi:hypothetical protein